MKHWFAHFFDERAVSFQEASDAFHLLSKNVLNAFVMMLVRSKNLLEAGKQTKKCLSKAGSRGRSCRCVA